MKFTPEVTAALDVLREHAENDFERHRLDVLERDLTAPPTVEIVDGTHQKFCNMIYNQNIGGHYVRHTSIHREIWQYHNGEIPDGYHIHHVDENKANNDIANLQCLSAAEHKTLHHRGICYNKQINGICANCGKPFTKAENGRNKFCSKKCKAQFEYKQNLERRICAWCGKEFMTNRYYQATCCSPKCAQKFLHKSKRITRICPICGKEFTVTKSEKKICCSRSCAKTLYWQKRHAGIN